MLYLTSFLQSLGFFSALISSKTSISKIFASFARINDIIQLFKFYIYEKISGNIYLFIKFHL